MYVSMLAEMFLGGSSPQSRSATRSFGNWIASPYQQDLKELLGLDATEVLRAQRTIADLDRDRTKDGDTNSVAYLTHSRFAAKQLHGRQDS